MSKQEKKKTLLSKIAVILLVIYYVLCVIALVCQDVGADLLKTNYVVANILYNKIWRTLSPLVLLIIPLLCGIPNLILCIVGMIKEKRVLPFLLCILLPIPIWIVVFSTAAMYI